MSQTMPSNIYIYIIVSVLVILSWLGFLDVLSADYIDGSIIQTTISFASARALNAAISVAQSAEISIMVANIGVGELLDPLNDLTEQYSTLVEYAIVSLLVQKLLLTITSTAFFKILLTLVATLIVGASYFNKHRYFVVGLKSFIFLAFLRFALVFVIILNGIVNQLFVNDQIEADMSQIQVATEELPRISKKTSIDARQMAELEHRLQALSKEDKVLSNEKNRLISLLAAKRKELEKSTQHLSKIEDGLSLTAKLNVFDRGADYANAAAAHDAADDAVDNLESQLFTLEQQLQNNLKEQTVIRNTMEGKSNGWLDTINNAAEKMVGGIEENITEQIDTLSSAVTNILNLMAAFLLKTLILPLIFLYMLFLFAKVILNIDISDYFPSKNSAITEQQLLNGDRAENITSEDKLVI